MKNKKANYKLSTDKVSEYVMWLAEALDIRKIEWRYNKK
jgi:hypothetical protein